MMLEVKKYYDIRNICIKFFVLNIYIEYYIKYRIKKDSHCEPLYKIIFTIMRLQII